MEIPIIDIFAGPGGLGEGFSALLDPESKKRRFKIALSIEKDEFAHKTLTLRSFFRQFPPGNVPPDYYEYIKGQITLDDLYKNWPEQAQKAKNDAWQAELGESEKAVSNSIVDKRIRAALEGKKEWLLIGGPPCQAYSVVGRSRRQEKVLDEKKDERVGLYKQYLRILAIHTPAVFIMENVKGLLSAITEENPVFLKILEDLSDPVRAYFPIPKRDRIKLKCPGYRIYSLVAEPITIDVNGNPVFCPKDFVIQSENYGIPQTRHRVILLGVRNDIELQPEILVPQAQVPISNVLDGLPRLRSSVSKDTNDGGTWKEVLKKISQKIYLNGIDQKVKDEILAVSDNLSLPKKEVGDEYIALERNKILYCPEWYLDEKLEGVCNHAARGHMESDLLRYCFASCFAKVKKRSPKLEDFPVALLPTHKNVQEGIVDKKFADRFRVQLWEKPCKTITSHISKDGHYYIHPDPTQCRSFTVREAARIQTFPDNYFFCGPRTSQFIQVGNAVPPLLAYQIARIVDYIFAAMNQDFPLNGTSKLAELTFKTK
jgi:DNA (cytosine-5)-methyltransferase 1